MYTLVKHVKLSTMSNCQILKMSKSHNVNNVKLSTLSNCQQYQIVNNVKLSNVKCQILKLSNCQKIKMSKSSNCQNVKLSQYQMSCIIRVCGLGQRIDYIVIFSIFLSLWRQHFSLFGLYVNFSRLNCVCLNVSSLIFKMTVVQLKEGVGGFIFGDLCSKA